MWGGEYDITMANNDTGEKEPHVGVISLEFSDDRYECVVQKGVTDLYAVTRKTYKAYLNEEEKSFMLNEGDYDSRVIYSGKVTDFDHATLTWYENDKEISITLEALRYE